MAQEILVKEALSTEMVSAGAELAQHLQKSSLTIDAMLWLYKPESNTWRFVIASPEVSSAGPRKVYQDIRSIISGIPEDQRRVSINDIFVVSSNDPVISHFRSAIPAGRSIAGIRFSQNVIDGVLIDDAYIYKLA
ncbi:MAG: hypothetical protein L0229_32040 [Blastocatellia bacterium]|nr:hypothetical protein [Blastocatellia bacterium]